MNGVYSSRYIQGVKRISNLPFGWELWHVVRPEMYHGILYDPKKMRQLELEYDIKYQDIDSKDMGGSGESANLMYSCYSKIDGGYIGTPEDTYHLFGLGISEIQKSHPDDNVCSIGFLEREQKWAGWSHRALCKFGIGDIVKEGDCCATSGWTDEYLGEHPEDDISLPIGFEAKTLEDAKTMAKAFAKSVS
jgi:hypothetical protein